MSATDRSRSGAKPYQCPSRNGLSESTLTRTHTKTLVSGQPLTMENNMNKKTTRISAILLSLLSIGIFSVSSLHAEISMPEAMDKAMDLIKPGEELVRVERKGNAYEIRIKTETGMKKMVLDASTGDPVIGKKQVPQNRMLQQSTGQSRISLDEAVAIATSEVPGKVVKIEYERGVYEVKIIDGQGSRVEVYIDAASGKILEIERKDKKRYKNW